MATLKLKNDLIALLRANRHTRIELRADMIVKLFADAGHKPDKDDEEISLVKNEINLIKQAIKRQDNQIAGIRTTLDSIGKIFNV